MANMFNEDGTYNKTSWKTGDRITEEKLNKIEESLEAINNNDISRHVEADTRLDAMEAKVADIGKNNRDNIKDYGAIGDWSSHPASEFYSSLEELKKDYPHAQSLNDEMDTLALEKALTSSYKTIYIPYGGYKINRAGFSISSNRVIEGDGKCATQLSYTGSGDEYIFISSDNIVVKDFKFTAPFTAAETGTSTTTKFIKVQGSTHNTFSNLFLCGFDIALDFQDNAWVQYINNIRIQNCNTGILGNGEFNNICIDECNITYCDTAIYAGGGRNIVIEKSDIERNNTGIVKINKGDIVIRDNYFEYNRAGNICIRWGISAVNMALIEGNSFFTSGDGEPMIMYHSYKEARITIINNNFESYNLTDGVNINCLTQMNNTAVCPTFKNNKLGEGYIVGVYPPYVNADGYYTNGLHSTYSVSTDLSNVLTSEMPTARLGFTAGGSIILPSFSSFEDRRQCFKIFTFASASQVTDDQYMTIDTTGKNIVGTSKIYPNQMYSIYFNRLVGELEEILIIKG